MRYAFLLCVFPLCISPLCRDAAWTCQYDSGMEDVQKVQVKTMKKAKCGTMKKSKSGCDSGLQQSHNKKPKKNHGSAPGTPGQNAEVKSQAVIKDACSSGPERSTDCSRTMQKQNADKKARSSTSSQEHLMRTLSAEDEKSDVDLYRGEEEIAEELKKQHQPDSEAVVEAQSSVSVAEDLQTYSEKEWRGNTTKSQLIRKGYEAIASEFQLCRVRGDNYCALRATLFQVLSQSRKIPAWLQDSDIVKWPKGLHSDENFLKEWEFPVKSKKNNVQHLEQCLDLLKKKWQEAVQCKTPAERERMCQQVFIGLDEEYELLEALKFLMLRTAAQLHLDMEKGSDVPEFCWLLFARDSSKCPKTLLTNHLRHVGFSGGLEQVEMCLLGHSLQQTIKVYRLYKCDTEEFITYYPNDHKNAWPNLVLLTEDDRHYNALIPKKSSKFDEYGRPKWNPPSDGQSNFTTPL